MSSSERRRRRLVAGMHATGRLSSPRVEAAFLAVAREHFLPETLAAGGLEAVYRDRAIATKRTPEGLPLSSSSQPSLMATMLELLDVQAGHRVLEIGAGTGYNAALLAHLSGPAGRVTSLDIDPELTRRARRSLRDAGARARILAGDGRAGHPPGAPYDRIIATAAADEIPSEWRDQLREGGRVVLPLRLEPHGAAIQLIPVLERRGGELRSVGLTWGGFMPLHGGDGGYPAPACSLSAVHGVKGAHTGLASLGGEGIGRLSTPAARRLLRSLLDDPGAPRRRGLTDLAGDRCPSVILHLLLNLPAARRLSLHHAGRWGVGVVDRRGRSAAIVSLRSPWDGGETTARRRARWRLDAYGADTAAAELDALLTQWRGLERAGRTTLRITARGEAGALRLRFAWAEGDA